MADVYQDTVIRYPGESHRDEETVLTIGITREYQASRRGDNYCATKTGRWIVEISVPSISSRMSFPPDVAPLIIDAIQRHSAECVRRNNPVLVPGEESELETVDA